MIIRKFLKTNSKIPLIFISLVIAILMTKSWFHAQAQRNPDESQRIKQAHINKDRIVAALLDAQRLDAQTLRLYIRAFKKEGQLEIWGRDHTGDRYSLIKTYPVCAASGILGPKQRQGDRQVPEGFYHIDRFNPHSRYHLSLGLDYPNRVDRQRAGKSNPGGDIFIHGNCVSIGCLAMRDDAIEEIYLLALLARKNEKIPVHIFPHRLDTEQIKILKQTTNNTTLQDFWEELQPAYRYFEQSRVLPKVYIDNNARYRIDQL